jgi:hypothetical protein
MRIIWQDEAARDLDRIGGVIYAHQREVSIGGCTLDLHLIADASEPEELRDRIIFLLF